MGISKKTASMTKKHFLFAALPFKKEEVTRALEAGIDGILTSPENLEKAAALGRFQVVSTEETIFFQLKEKQDENEVVSLLAAGQKVILRRGWEIIPVENILAQVQGLGLEVANLEEARLAAGIMERGVTTIVLLPEAVEEIRKILTVCLAPQNIHLQPATVVDVQPVGSGDRVCVDTLSLLHAGEGLLVGNTSACTFLVQGETQHNAYVAPRPFRINAGGVHAYVRLPHNTTAYLEELRAGSEVLLVAANGSCRVAVVGRNKTEIRPMILIRAECQGVEGQIFLQNAETVRLVCPDGTSVSVTHIRPGDTVLCCLDIPGRHFGIAVEETIREQ